MICLWGLSTRVIQMKMRISARKSASFYQLLERTLLLAPRGALYVVMRYHRSGKGQVFIFIQPNATVSKQSLQQLNTTVLKCQSVPTSQDVPVVILSAFGKDTVISIVVVSAVGKNIALSLSLYQLLERTVIVVVTISAAEDFCYCYCISCWRGCRQVGL